MHSRCSGKPAACSHATAGGPTWAAPAPCCASSSCCSCRDRWPRAGLPSSCRSASSSTAKSSCPCRKLCGRARRGLVCLYRAGQARRRIGPLSGWRPTLPLSFPP